MRRLASLLCLAALGGVLLLGCGGSGAGSASSTAGAAGAGGASHSKTASGADLARRARAKMPSKSRHGPPPLAYSGTRRLPFGAATPSAAQRSRLAATGRVTIPVRVEGSGVVSAFGQAEFEGTIRKIAHATPMHASGTGVVPLTLKLTPRARRYLAAGAGHSILMYVGVLFSKSNTAQRLVVPLRG